MAAGHELSYVAEAFVCREQRARLGLDMRPEIVIGRTRQMLLEYRKSVMTGGAEHRGDLARQVLIDFDAHAVTLLCERHEIEPVDGFSGEKECGPNVFARDLRVAGQNLVG